MALRYEPASLLGTGVSEEEVRALVAEADRAAPSLRTEAFCAALDRGPPPPPPSRAERVVVLGIGGSALGARAVHEARASPSALPLVVVDNGDPALLERAWRSGDPARTAWVVVSKSGTTIETLAQCGVVRERLRAAGAWRGVHVVTGAKGPLRQLAFADGLALHEVPEEVGGRFSVFTAAGTVPLALAGLDVAALLDGARAARDHAARPGSIPAQLAALLVAAYRRGRSVVALWAYAERLEAVGEWFRQLWAESLGKRGPDGEPVGQTPLPCVGTTDQHSVQQLLVEGPRDKAALVLAVPPEEETTCPVGPFGAASGERLGDILRAMRRATTAEMVRAGIPAATLHLRDASERTIGALLMTFLCTTVIAGRLLGVDPYGQPGVEAAKLATLELLRHPGGPTDRAVAATLLEGAGTEIV
jgi:glucose-6-phosphate isomerase